jgi:hypothetical protein
VPHNLEKAVEELAQGLILLVRGVERMNHVIRHDDPHPSCPWCPIGHNEGLRLLD